MQVLSICPPVHWTQLAYAGRAFVVCGIIIGFELKNVTLYHDNEAIIKLLIASLSLNYAIVIVLTDLGNVWHFFWLEKGMTVSCELNLLQAINLLESITESITESIARGGTSNTFEVTTDKCRVQDAVSRNTIRGSSESNESAEGIERIFNRPRVVMCVRRLL